MKKFWQSKTFWVNVLTLLAALAPPVRDFLITLGLPTEWVVSLLAAVNVVLRFITNKSITVK